MASILFACGTPHGGALDSTMSLARSAVEAGHDVRLVIAARDPYAVRPRLTAALVKVERAAPPLGTACWAAYRCLAGRARATTDGELTTWRATDVPAAVSRVMRSTDLLVVNSVRKLDLRRLAELAHRRGARVVWYLREPQSLVAAPELHGHVDVMIANSRPLAASAEAATGRECCYVGSAISRDGLMVPAQRRSLLLVNPVAAFGVEESLALARRMPGEHIVLQESWPLSEAEFDALSARTAALANVEIRRRTSRDQLFRDTKALLAPYSASEAGLSRPRVVLEAQYVGVPVIAHDVPGLASVQASPDLLVPMGTGGPGWAAAVQRLESGYENYCSRAREFADLEMGCPADAWGQFASVCGIDAPGR